MSKMLRILLLMVTLWMLIETKVSYKNIQTLFNYTYDANHDGEATILEVSNYFSLLEPQGPLSQTTIESVFSFYDANNDSLLTIDQLSNKISGILFKSQHLGPKQIHIGLTSLPNEMQIMWVTTPESCKKPQVLYSKSMAFLPHTVMKIEDVESWTYTAGHIGFHGRIYRGVIKELQAGCKYYYKVGDRETGIYSNVKYFIGPPELNKELDEIHYAVVGDVGTFTPFGWMVLHQIAISNQVSNYGFMFLTGDIAYAGISSQNKGEIQPVWDLFGQLAQQFSAYIPFMPGVGNHQKYYNYSAYFNRYVLPRRYEKQTNLWFSFDYGQLHVIHFSSESHYQKGSQQYNFLEQDLKAASENPNTKWIVLSVHRTFYSPDKRQFKETTPLAEALQELINFYKVDLVHQGHHHDYSRTWPVFKGVPEKSLRHNETHYFSPSSPIYIVQGTGGGLMRDQPLTQIPDWSIKRITKLGFGKVVIRNNTLWYRFIAAPTGKTLDEWFIVK